MSSCGSGCSLLVRTRAENPICWTHSGFFGTSLSPVAAFSRRCRVGEGSHGSDRFMPGERQTSLWTSDWISTTSHGDTGLPSRRTTCVGPWSIRNKSGGASPCCWTGRTMTIEAIGGAWIRPISSRSTPTGHFARSRRSWCRSAICTSFPNSSEIPSDTRARTVTAIPTAATFSSRWPARRRNKNACSNRVSGGSTWLFRWRFPSSGNWSSSEMRRGDPTCVDSLRTGDLMPGPDRGSVFGWHVAPPGASLVCLGRNRSTPPRRARTLAARGSGQTACASPVEGDAEEPAAGVREHAFGNPSVGPEHWTRGGTSAAADSGGHGSDGSISSHRDQEPARGRGVDR